jgi:hypothetical protein
MGLSLVFGGNVLSLHELGHPIDEMFARLHTAYLSNGILDWREFESASFQYFDTNAQLNGIFEEYFQNFTIIWNHSLSSGNFDQGERLWSMALDTVQKWEAMVNGRRIHKGALYYFWGMSCLLRGNLDKGYCLMHQAVEEDRVTHHDLHPNTPALAFACLNYSKMDQAFRDWVVKQANFLESKVADYRTDTTRNFLLNEFKSRFLDSTNNIDVVFLFAYTVARFMTFSDIPMPIIQNGFAGQLEQDLLFDLTLVIDSAIKAKNQNGNTFIDHAEFLLNRSGHQLTNQNLREINTSFRNDFDNTVTSLVQSRYVLPKGLKLDNFQSHVALAYGLRNHGAHNVVTSQAIWQNFHDILRNVFNVLFMTVDYLY